MQVSAAVKRTYRNLVGGDPDGDGQGPRDPPEEPDSHRPAKKGRVSTDPFLPLSIATRSTSSPLYDQISHDIQPKGQRIFIPFFTTEDLLRLSECSKDLQDYRYYLLRLKLVKPYHINQQHQERITDGVLRLLAGQRSSLEYVLVEHGGRGHPLDLPAVRESVVGVGGWKVKALELPNLGQSSDEQCVSFLGMISGLEELSISHQGMRFVMRALSQGCCRSLTVLYCRGNCVSGPHSKDTESWEAFASALNQGYCRRMKVLVVSPSDWEGPEDSSDFVVVAAALQAGACPHLMKLDLSSAFLNPPGWLAVGQAIQSGHCQELKSLSVGWAALGATGLLPVIQALQDAQNGPELLEFELFRVLLTAEGATALSQLLSSGRCRSLERLSIKGVLRGGGHIAQILQGMGSGGCRELRSLDLLAGGMDEDGGRVLGEILRGGSCPKLVKLVLSGNMKLGDSGMSHVIGALEAGACPGLTRLDLAHVGMASNAANMLARMLSLGSQPLLEVLDLMGNRHPGEAAIDCIISSVLVRSRLRCLYLVEVHIGESGLGDLLRALGNNAWPLLEDLHIDYRDWTGEFLTGLSSALTQGQFSRLKGLAICCIFNKNGLHRLARAFRAKKWPFLVSLSIVTWASIDVSYNQLMSYCTMFDRSLNGKAKVKMTQILPGPNTKPAGAPNANAAGGN